MKIERKAGGQLITLSRAFDNRAKILNLFYSIVFLLPSLVICISLLNEYQPADASIFAIVGSIIMFIASYRFGNKAIQTQQLFIDEHSLTLITKGFSKKKKIFELALISNFRHLAKPELTRHPLAGESMDYLGFQTEQQVINEMHGDNRLAFDYEGATVKFGENIYSWDFEELQSILPISFNEKTRL